MLFEIIASLFGVAVYLFLYWKRMKEDYSSEIIFSSSLLILVGLTLGSFLSFQLLKQYWFWFSLLGVLLGLTLSVFRFKVRFYETLEALVVSLLPLTSFVFLVDSVNSLSISSFLAFVVTVSLLGLTYFFDRKYKLFNWYKSGRIGFTGLAVSALFFLLRAVVSLIGVSVISFVGKIEPLASGIVSFTLFLLLFNLSRKIS
jgi:hypothetical protein